MTIICLVAKDTVQDEGREFEKKGQRRKYELKTNILASDIYSPREKHARLVQKR